jgi:hypothetical protein
MREPLRIRVIIEGGRFGEVIADVASMLSPEMDEVMTPLKLSDGAPSFFDTPQSTIQRVMAMRSFSAQNLAPEVAKVLIEAMRSRDTINGYTKAERDEINGKGGE